MILQDSYRRIPDDDEFKKELLIKDVYHFRNRNYILRKLENYDRKELVDIDSYTIEHIMPQNPKLSVEWITDLGEKWKEIQKIYLHTIGNLTLTGYNSELSDNPFKIKRDMTGGFKDSPIRINRSLSTLETWNEQEIQKRAEEIFKLAIHIWNYPLLEKEVLDKYRIVDEEFAKPKYTIEHHDHLREGEPMRPLFEELRKKILNIDSSVKEEPLKLYVAYKSITNFVDIVPQKRALCLILNISFDKIKDPFEKCIDITGIGKWGNGDVEFKLTSESDLDYALNLIKQAFDNVIGQENGE
jgi:predicted transport protein